MFSDFVYHNIGAPVNPNTLYLSLDASLNPAGTAFVDFGPSGSVLTLRGRLF